MMSLTNILLSKRSHIQKKSFSMVLFTYSMRPNKQKKPQRLRGDGVLPRTISETGESNPSLPCVRTHLWCQGQILDIHTLAAFYVNDLVKVKKR